MNLMAFGILRAPGPLRQGTIDAPPGWSVALMAVDGLAAAYTSLSSREPPTVPRLLDYARVVAALHRRETILPLRYGCWFDSEADLERSLHRRRTTLLEALSQLEGCDEMSLWLLPCDDPPQPSPTAATVVTAPGTDRGLEAERPGTAHILQLRTRFAEQDARRARTDAALATIRRALEGFYVRCRAEPMPARGLPRLLSLAFLVRKSELQRFCNAVETLRQQPGGDGLRLTGPWPPYHFIDVQPEDSAP